MISNTVGRNLRKILLFFNILLAVLIAWMVFDVVSFWVSLPNGVKAPAINPLSGTPSKRGILLARRSLADYQLLSTADIFKISPRSNPSEAKSSLEDHKGASLDLKLKGTILRNNGQSYAVIEDKKTKTQLLYSLNEQVHGARIIAIEPDHIVLSVEGKDEVLVMSEEAEPESISASPPPGDSPPGARAGQGNRKSRPVAAKPELTDRTAQQTDQDGVFAGDRGSPSGGGQTREGASQSNALRQGKQEEQPSK